MGGDADTPLERPAVVLNTFDVYESKAQLYIIGSSESRGYYRVLRINRTASSIQHIVEDDGIVHSRDSVQQVIADIQSANGAKLLIANVCGILGFVRFTKGYYISLVTKRKPVALLGGHHVYHVEDTRLLSIASRPERSDREDKYIYTFKNVDLTKNFYYSHTYDITHTLQRNVAMGTTSSPLGKRGEPKHYNSMFVWNYQLICNATQAVGIRPEWTVALIHGYVDQSKLSIFGRDVYITLIARRSRIFAGVRYLKRGVNDSGYVANDVETEQIVNTLELTSFDMPCNLPFSNPSYTSYVQHRGSIPLFWSQDTSGIVPKPPIEINVHDPYFVEAGKHFDSLFRRYGTPVIVLNLVKTKERTKRESALGEEFAEGLRYLNQFLPKGKKIRYVAWDMSRANKNRQEDVLAILEVIAEETLALTGFFHNGPELYSNYLKRRNSGDSRPRRDRTRIQTGIVRSNCIDCLDRTNAAQSIIGKVVLAHQLFELGQIDEPCLSFNTDAAMIIEEMYHDLGNTIALQYGGSHLVNTVQTYRRNTNWRSHSRDIVEALRRYYSNSLLDMERQEAITFFLERCLLDECKAACQGGSPANRQMDSADNGWFASNPNQVGKPVFRKWWTTLGASDEESASEDALELNGSGSSNRSKAEVEYANGSPSTAEQEQHKAHSSPDFRVPGRHHAPANPLSQDTSDAEEEMTSSMATDSRQKSDIENDGEGHEAGIAAARAAGGYWDEYYRPHEYTSFDSLFVGNLNSSASLHPNTEIQNMPSPFTDRGRDDRKSNSHARHMQQEPKWLKSESDEYADPTLVSRKEIYEKVCAKTLAPQVLQPMGIGGWATDGVSAPLQEPKVSQAELEEYEKYVHQFDDLKKWIVPPSRQLYVDYVNGQNRGGTPIPGLSPVKLPSAVAARMTNHGAAAAPATTGRLRLNASDITFLRDAERLRSQTPTPGQSRFAGQMLPSATPSRGHLHRLLSTHSAQKQDPKQQQENRLRSNTSSERSTLWGLWPHLVETPRTRHASTLGNNSDRVPAVPPGISQAMGRTLTGTSSLRGHDRSRSLDFSKAAIPTAQPSFAPSKAESDAAVAEPRVSEADLKIYQEYVKMRKAIGGQGRA